MSLVNSLFKYKDKPVFLCVGTDKVVGDSIGAIVGEILTNNDSISGYIYGNLEHNITATNISDTIFKIKKDAAEYLYRIREKYKILTYCCRCCFLEIMFLTMSRKLNIRTTTSGKTINQERMIPASRNPIKENAATVTA